MLVYLEILINSKIFSLGCGMVKEDYVFWIPGMILIKIAYGKGL